MTTPAEPTITAGQLTELLDVVDLDKLRDAGGRIDSVKVATLLGSVPPPPARKGPTATGHTPSVRSSRGGSGRDMFEQRHRKPSYDA